MNRSLAILCILTSLLASGIAAPAEARTGRAQARRHLRTWKKRLETRTVHLQRAVRRRDEWARTLERQRRDGAPAEDIERSKAKKVYWGDQMGSRGRRKRQAERKVAHWKKEMRNDRIGARALRKVMPNLSATGARRAARSLGQAMSRYRIDNRRRAAMFIAQIAHESGELRYTREIWGPTAAQRTYAYRLGNHGMSDAYRYRGGGYIQLTGKSNYRSAAAGTGLPLVARPGLLDRGRYAALVSAWWWKRHGLNGIADRGDFLLATRTINGGTNGYADRLKYYRRARGVAGGLVPR